MDDNPPQSPPTVPPPPDPRKVVGQVVLDLICLILTIAVALAVALWLVEFRRPGDTASEILVSLLTMSAAIALVFLGFWFRSRVRALFGVADTAKNEADDTGEPARPIPPDPEEDDLSEPTECLKCRSYIPAGAATCPRCGWSYRENNPLPP